MGEAPGADAAYVDVPHEPTLSRSTGPSRRVPLPLAVNPGCGLLSGACLVFGGALTTAAVPLYCLGFMALPASPHSAGMKVVVAFLLVFGAVSFSYFALLAWTRLIDRLRRRPMVTIGLDGIRDRRLSPDLLPWSAMEQITLHMTKGHVTLTLRLRSGFTRRHWPFRPGLSMPWQLAANETEISLAHLNPGGHVIAHVVCAMAERNGVKILAPAPPSIWGFVSPILLLFVLHIVARL